MTKSGNLVDMENSAGIMRGAHNVIYLRCAQLFINRLYAEGVFKIPIHLALGHEAIAVAVDEVMQDGDGLFLTHRNIHYNLCRAESLRAIISEYALESTGLARGSLGSMNLSNPDKSIYYSSSILGNNLPVACGYALGSLQSQTGSCTFVVTGDGAIEEGAFWETLIFVTAQRLPIVIIVENNSWSLATNVSDRRGEIELPLVARAVGASYIKLQDNDLVKYCEELRRARSEAVEEMTPVIVEVELTTLGGRMVQCAETGKDRLINYHAGPVPSITADGSAQIEASTEDPVFALTTYLTQCQLESRTKQVWRSIKANYQ